MAVTTPWETDTQTVIQMYADYVMRTYRRQPVVFIRGKGMKVWDAEGREYLDFLAGIAVNGLGHCHPALVDAISRQAAELMHVCNLYHVPQQAALAKRLVQLSGLGKAFFCNSGAEANETAIKLARKWAKQNAGPEKFEIITAEGSFHGRTLAAVTATGQPKCHHGFEPLVPGFKYVPFNDLSALEAAVTDRTCAIMLEPVQGESGIRPAGKDYLKGVRVLCDECGLLLILDEVQTGLGRTGKWFGHEHYDIKPDIMTLAKTLGGGFPIGACLAADRVAEAFGPGSHAATFGGNPLACAAALATLDVMERERLIENAADTGAYFRKALDELKGRRNDIAEVRGIGLMLAIEMDRDDALEVAARCLQKGLIVNPVGQSVIRFLPPLIVQKEHVDSAVRILGEALSETAK
ncbi:MAG TPA: acetylornithine transaminase [Armatimonadota bacterium]|nr:acetylornithine transaminase [Armatimonadota bacterium]